MKNKKFKFTALFENNKFVLIISLLLAFVIWLTYSMYGGEEQQKSIDVPIQMDSLTVPKQFNLRQFGEYSNSAVTVTIKGKKAVVGTVTAEDIKVVASTLDVNTAGKHNLPLSVTIDSNKDFEIVSTNTLSVEVYFDAYKEVTMAVTMDLSTTPLVPSGYELGTITLSKEKLLAYGPSTEVSKIDRILAQADVGDNLTKTTSYDANIVAVDKYNNEIQNISFKNADKFTVTVPVFKLATLPVSVQLTNMPDGITADDLSIKYSTANLEIAGEESTVKKLKAVNIGTIDFSDLTNSENKFTFETGALAGLKVKSDISKITVNIDLSSYKSNTITVPSSAVEIVNATGKTVKLSGTALKIKAVGSTSSVKSLTADDLSVVLNVTDDTKTGSNQNLGVTVKITSDKNSWIVGSYTVKATIE